MRIAQVAPLYESVPPQLYGGTERVVSYLTEELVRMGHEVTLFASGDSQTAARLVPVTPRSLRLDSSCIDQLAHHIYMLEEVKKRKDDFDLIHFHIDYLHFPITRMVGWNHVTTLHGRLDLPDLIPLHKEFSDLPLISISMSQRKPLPFVNWVGTVLHGIPIDLLEFNSRPKGYLAFCGRICPEKRVDRAIEISLRAGLPLKIAAKVDPTNRDYFYSDIEPLLHQPGIEFIGEINDRQKSDFLGNARALLFPIDWPEPFGLVMIEAMACGTPVIAYRNGSVEEVLEKGVTGYIVDNVTEAVEAVAKVGSLDRRKCREVFERRFSATKMAQEYVQLYDKLIERERLHGKNDYHQRSEVYFSQFVSSRRADTGS